MEIENKAITQSEAKGPTAGHGLILSLTIALVLLLTVGGSALYGQKAPNAPSAPQVAPEPPEPPDAPEPPELPDPPDVAQVFVLNDGGVRLGVTLSEVTSEKAVQLNLPTVAGAIVDSVQKNSAAAKAGLEAGDAIIEFDGVHVRSCAELRRLIRETPAGRTVAIKVVRGGKAFFLTAKLEASNNQFSYNMPEIRIPPMNFRMPKMDIPPMEFPEAPTPGELRRATLGIAGDDLTPQLAKYFGVNQGTGVLISEVTIGGPADKAGLKAGDIIIQVDGLPVRGVQELRHALNDNFPGDTRKVNLTIVRDRHEQTVSAELTRSQPLEKRTSNGTGPASELDFGLLPAQTVQLRSQADQMRAQANQIHALADTQRAVIQSEVLQQQKYLKSEWQQQLQQQMRSLKDELQQMKDLHVTVNQDGEI